jgi:hypothetical protein
MREELISLSLVRSSLLRVGLACLLGLVSVNAAADPAALRAKYGELREVLRNNNFQRALHIDSSEGANNHVTGDVYAVLDHPFDVVSGALKEPSDWCEILLLPFNTKYCRPGSRDGAAGLQVRIGRKFDQPLDKAYRIDFAWRKASVTPDYLETRLDAAQGPLGTRDYRIAVSAIPLDGGRTFMHLSYSYGFGLAGRVAMQAYLATTGADKVGFTVTGKDANGRPIYIGGMRGAIERNAMRYYLAIDAHLGSRQAPADQQFAKSIQTWFDASERYARQLHEMDRATYLGMKRSEYQRQQTAIAD